MKRKAWLLCGLFFGYFGISLLVATIFSAVSLQLLRDGLYPAASWSATIARVGIFPYRILPLAEVQAADTGLRILQLTGRYKQHFPTWKAIVRFEAPLTPESLESSIEFLDLLSPLFTQLEDHLQSSVLAQKGPFSRHIHALSALQEFSHPTRKFLLSLQDLQPGTAVHYLVLLQNNRELRPTGGFMGSYALVSFRLNQPISLEIQDIYVPDGQLEGHVEPPGPIQEAFQQGFWKLRDANWHPHFPSSAQNVQWFFEEAMNIPIDGVAAINYSSFEKLLSIFGEMKLTDYQETLNADNLYLFLQHTVEKNFFPGSTQKRDVLRSLTQQVQSEITHLPSEKVLQLPEFFLEQLNDKEILLWSTHDELQDVFATLGWAGRVLPASCAEGADCIADTFSLFDANLGVNKTNCCINRQVVLEKKLVAGSLISEAKILYTHTGVPTPEYSPLIGDYRAYVRAYLPAGTNLDFLTINLQEYPQFIAARTSLEAFPAKISSNVSVSEVNGLTELGFWIVVPQDEAITVKFRTSTPVTSSNTYQLRLLKQSGTSNDYNTYQVTLDGDILFSGTLQRDQIITK